MTSYYDVRKFSFLNDTGATIPPFACLHVTGAILDGTEEYLAIKKPDAETERLQSRSVLAFNLDLPVENGQHGACVLSMPGQVLIDDTAGTAHDRSNRSIRLGGSAMGELARGHESWKLRI